MKWEESEKRVRREWERSEIRKQLIRFIKLTGFCTLTNHSITINNFLIIISFILPSNRIKFDVFNRRHFWLILKVHKIRRKKEKNRMINDMQLRRTNSKTNFSLSLKSMSFILNFFLSFCFLLFIQVETLTLNFWPWSLIHCTLNTLRH